MAPGDNLFLNYRLLKVMPLCGSDIIVRQTRYLVRTVAEHMLKSLIAFPDIAVHAGNNESVDHAFMETEVFRFGMD